MITGSVSLALCTVVFRRFLDSYSGRIPKVVPASNYNVTSSTMVILSGALYYLYSHLKRGTLVRVGTKNQLGLYKTSSSNCRIQKRKGSQKSMGWFFRNADSCRNKCTEAIYKVAKQSFDSLLKTKSDETNSISCINKEPTPDQTSSTNTMFNKQVYSVCDLTKELHVDKSVQNIMSTDKIKKVGKRMKRIAFKLNEDEPKRGTSSTKLKRNKKLLVRNKSDRNIVIIKKTLKRRRSRQDFCLKKFMANLIPWKKSQNTRPVRRNKVYFCKKDQVRYF